MAQHSLVPLIGQHACVVRARSKKRKCQLNRFVSSGKKNRKNRAGLWLGLIGSPDASCYSPKSSSWLA